MKLLFLLFCTFCISCTSLDPQIAQFYYQNELLGEWAIKEIKTRTKIVPLSKDAKNLRFLFKPNGEFDIVTTVKKTSLFDDADLEGFKIYYSIKKTSFSQKLVFRMINENEEDGEAEINVNIKFLPMKSISLSDLTLKLEVPDFGTVNLITVLDTILPDIKDFHFVLKKSSTP